MKITINRKDKNQSWGFKIVGGVDVGLVLKVLRIVGVDTPAYESGLLEHDVIVSVGEELVTLMTHQQAVDTIKRVTGTSLELTVQRGDHIVPSLAECFPAGEEVRHTVCSLGSNDNVAGANIFNHTNCLAANNEL